MTVIILLLGSACSGARDTEPVASEEPTKDQVVTGEAQVESIQINIMESFPVQVSVTVRGSLPDGCTEIDQIVVEREGDTFLVTITTVRPSEAVCIEILGSFEEIVSLDVLGLPAGVYTVNVNGVRDTFELTLDNVPQTDEVVGGTESPGPPTGALVSESFDDLGVSIRRPDDWVVERLPGVYGLVPPGVTPETAPYIVSFSFIGSISVDDLDTMTEALTAYLEGQGERDFRFGPTFLKGADGVIVYGLKNICQLIVAPGGGSVRTVTISPDACDESGAVVNQTVKEILDSMTFFEPTM